MGDTVRKLTMADLIGGDEEETTQNQGGGDNQFIPKNQKDFGHKKRIKP